MKALQERVERNEQRQQQMVAFLAQAMQHPALVQHLMTSSSAVKRIDDGKRESSATFFLSYFPSI